MTNLAADGRFDRRAALDSAQRLMQQNKLPQAIEAYERLTRQDANDWASGNTYGDLLVRVHRSDQAIGEYLRVAHYLADAGFLARASAIYKKVLRLDPAHIEALRELESLNVHRFAKPGDPARRIEEQPGGPPNTVASSNPKGDNRPECTWSLDLPDPSTA